MTNEELVTRIQANLDVSGNMLELWQNMKSLIHSMAWKYKGFAELEDLEQEGYLALYPAVDGFEPAAGCKFSTYAEYWIKQRIQRYIQNNGSCLRLPVHCLETVLKYKQFCSTFAMEHGREPSRREATAHLGFSLEQIEGIQKNACLTSVQSLDVPIAGVDGGDDAVMSDFIPSDMNLEEQITDTMEHEQLCEELWACVDALEDVQADVIRKRYQDNMTLRQIGEESGMTFNQVRQQEQKGMRKLRRYSNHLSRFLPEVESIYISALHGNGVGRFDSTWTSSTERTALRLCE